MSKKIRWHSALVLTLGLAAAVPQASAAPLASLDSADFNYRWDFNQTSPNVDASFDLYNNTSGSAGPDSVNDWTKNTQSTGVSIAGGVLVMEETLSPAIGIDNVVWDNAVGLTATSGYTLETRLKIDTTPGANGLTLYPSPNGGGVGAMSFKRAIDDQSNQVVDIYWSANGNPANAATAAQKKATLPAADFFTVRVAADYDAGAQALVFSLYLDDTLVADGLAKSFSSAADQLLIGKIGGSHSGKMQVDYLAFTPGAFAPVPEPGAATLLGLGAWCLSARRRSHSVRS